MEKSRSTRKNHIGQYTTTIILVTGRIHAWGRTRADANIAADNKLAALVEVSRKFIN